MAAIAEAAWFISSIVLASGGGGGGGGGNTAASLVYCNNDVIGFISGVHLHQPLSALNVADCLFSTATNTSQGPN